MRKNYILGVVISILLSLPLVVSAASMTFLETNTTAEQKQEEIYNVPKTTLYNKEDSSITIEVLWNEVDNYLSTNQWGTEPMTKMYSADGRILFIGNSEVINYQQVGWSTYPPVTIYSRNATMNVLAEHVDMYVSTGVWYRSASEVPQINITRDIYTKTNLSAEELERCLEKGLKGYGQAFKDMEQTYGINAVFAISVAELESGYGTSYAFRNKNNAFGIGPGKRFNSVQEGINYFGQLMNKSLYKGKSIDKVGSIYCVGGNWSTKVKNLLTQNYQQIGY